MQSQPFMLSGIRGQGSEVRNAVILYLRMTGEHGPPKTPVLTTHNVTSMLVGSRRAVTLRRCGELINHCKLAVNENIINLTEHALSA